VYEQLSLSRGDKWDPSPSDETVDLISSLDRPAFDALDYINWCRFLDRDMSPALPKVPSTLNMDYSDRR
jgi:hypothetical protein